MNPDGLNGPEVEQQNSVLPNQRQPRVAVFENTDWRLVLFLQDCSLNLFLRNLAQTRCCKQDPFKGHPMLIPQQNALRITSIPQKHFISASTPTCLNSVHNPDFKISRVNILDSWPKCGCSS